MNCAYLVRSELTEINVASELPLGTFTSKAVTSKAVENKIQPASQQCALQLVRFSLRESQSTKATAHKYHGMDEA